MSDSDQPNRRDDSSLSWKLARFTAAATLFGTLGGIAISGGFNIWLEDRRAGQEIDQLNRVKAERAYLDFYRMARDAEQSAMGLPRLLIPLEPRFAKTNLKLALRRLNESYIAIQVYGSGEARDAAYELIGAANDLNIKDPDFHKRQDNYFAELTEYEEVIRDELGVDD